MVGNCAIREKRVHRPDPLPARIQLRRGGVWERDYSPPGGSIRSLRRRGKYRVTHSMIKPYLLRVASQSRTP